MKGAASACTGEVGGKDFREKVFDCRTVAVREFKDNKTTRYDGDWSARGPEGLSIESGSSKYPEIQHNVEALAKGKRAVKPIGRLHLLIAT